MEVVGNARCIFILYCRNMDIETGFLRPGRVQQTWNSEWFEWMKLNRPLVSGDQRAVEPPDADYHRYAKTYNFNARDELLLHQNDGWWWRPALRRIYSTVLSPLDMI